MGSPEQQQRQLSDANNISSRLGGSNRIVAVDVSPSSNLDTPPTYDAFSDSHDEKPGWRKLLSYVGPGFLVSMAYIDPGSLETDLQAGAGYRYQLLWVVLVGMLFVLIIQSLAANLGVVTGKHLSEICRDEYPLFVRYCLWLLAEVAVIAADIPEVIGTASALNILFHIPEWAGVLLTGCSTLLLLGLQRFGVRKMELLISILVFLMAACFVGEINYVKPPALEVVKGLFVPKLSGQGAVGDAIAVLGQTIVPHNLFLHSALVLSRKTPSSVRGTNDACRYFLIETGFALFIAFLINIAIIAVSGAVCSASNLSAENNDRCNDLTLNSASFLLKNVLGRSSSTIYAIALLASGQSSTITGTYAGQFIMQGFLNLKMKRWISNLMTRSIAILPSLIVSIVSGPSGASRLIIIASIMLSFELPFALIPLLKFSGSSRKMGPHKNSIIIIIISWILSIMMIVFNVYYLGTAFVRWLIHSSLPKVANVFIGIIVFPIMAIYVASIIYLALRKDTVKTYTETRNDPVMQTHIESGQMNPSGHLELSHASYREDLADIPLPK